MIDFILVVLKFLGVTSVFGALSVLVAYYAFPPNLSIVETKNKGSINFESRFVVKNIGKLPAFNVIIDVANMNFVTGMITSTNNNFTDCGQPITKMTAGEFIEIPVCSQVSVPPGTSLQSCDYDLILKYHFQLLFFKKLLKKRWRVELRNSGTDFTWQALLR